MGHKISLFEKAPNLFYGASGNNQFRHHKGYHYPRSLQTINMIRNNGVRFEQDYGFCLRYIPYNYYGIAESSSIMDSGIYEKIFPELESITNIPSEFKHLSSIYKTKESLIYIDPIIKYFNRLLQDNIHYNSELKTSEYPNYDLILDCTNNSNHSLDLLQKKYKLYIMERIISKAPAFSLTVMDGDFFSVYPYSIDNHLYSLSHVKYSDLNLELSEKERLEYILESADYFIDSFSSKFRNIGNFIGLKNFNKQVKDASRLLEYTMKDNVLSFSISKILSIYEIEDKLMEILQ
jgi:hypothetical protein